MKYHNIKLWKIKRFQFSMTKWYSKKNHLFYQPSLDKYNSCLCRTITGIFSTRKIARTCFCCPISLITMWKRRFFFGGGGGASIYIYIYIYLVPTPSIFQVAFVWFLGFSPWSTRPPGHGGANHLDGQSTDPSNRSMGRKMTDRWDHLSRGAWLQLVNMLPLLKWGCFWNSCTSLESWKKLMKTSI